ncbi:MULTISPECIES: type II secretion system protein GspM [unclassified Undibacterium]|uniref:type II secretion system protein GspM n=1 Tax=unclassified Undibacterium TaxID=2630295 RepID=UPI002AC954B1|nr:MULTISPECIES: type II secretion system protein GspM [unclassified Undibacterium]MEB0138343.1 type II secretion system protein GspM [Undibacterium sp. CCC2.1]MEB0172720.1 type II secretion system protein GspM [Undibacterium sp. CCC1.1]MEB0174718.1 type II secretion system protein GspM [Undibacterium sp. CCC3.4]MEB0213915.1 type II secretion system protein GspM [Undibacterium sp. 5I2]WPX42639.1 type II secretion system protein GspM [Undibacterium sp. CCC3.4]
MRKHFFQQWRQFWQQRNGRERSLLMLAAGVIALALLYLVLLDPALAGRAKLQLQIPQLRQHVAEMSALSAQHTKLAAGLSQILDPVSREVLEKSLAARGIQTQNLSVSDDMVRLQITTVEYAQLMAWLVEMQKTAKLTVEEARLNALPESGQVNVNLTLKQQRSGT